jgi:hypothetical protein
MQLKVGDKVSFKFLGEPKEGIIDEILPLPYGIDQELRHLINDGKYKYPIKKKDIQNKL